MDDCRESIANNFKLNKPVHSERHEQQGDKTRLERQASLECGGISFVGLSLCIAKNLEVKNSLLLPRKMRYATLILVM